MKLRNIVAALGASLPLIAATANAQTWPARPINVIEPFAAGGAVDAAVRAVTERAAAILGQNFIVEARPGAGTRLGTEAIVKAPKDGHTIGVMVSASGVNIPALDPKVTYDPLRDFTLLTLGFDANYLIVANPATGIRSVADLVAAGKKTPSPAYGTSGVGTSSHLWVEVFQSATGSKFTHVPYKGESASMQDLLGGQTQFTFANTGLAKPHVDAGKLVALAYTATERTRLLPNVPTVIEAGIPGFSAGGWVAFIAPAGIPRDASGRLTTVLREALRNPEVGERLNKAGFNVRATTPDEFATQMRAEIEKIRAVGKSSGIVLVD